MISAAAWSIALLLKPSIVVAGAAVAVSLLSTRGAAARHTVWAGAVVAVLLLPLLAAFLPPLRLPRVTAAMTRAAERQAAARTPTSNGAAASRGTPAPTARSRGLPHVPHVPRDRGGAVWILWAVVAAWRCARRVRAERAAHRIVSSGSAPSEALASRCASIVSRHQFRFAAVVVSDEIPSPAVAGIRRPTLLLPSAADSWSDAQLTAVVVHELAHVARRDGLVNLVADLASAVYWCNPLVHLATRRLRAESERACDDCVIVAGADPDRYALLLLELARAAHQALARPRAVALAPAVTSAMTLGARPSELEARLRRVLDRHVVRSPMRRRATGAVAVASLLAAAPVAAATARVAPRVAGPASAQSDAPHAPEPDLLQDSITTGERLPAVFDEARVMTAARRALSGPDSAAAARLLPALAHVPSHPNDLVRERAAWALSRTRGDRMLAPVIEALGSPDWRVQAYAAWTVGVVGDRRAVDPLLPLMRHPAWRVRAMAAFALGALPDRRSLDVMLAALGDPAWQVRSEAVEYLGALPATPYQDRIRARLDDRHVAVRQAAAAALTTP